MLQIRVPRRFVPQTTDSRHEQPIASNRLAQAPAPNGPNQQWVTDITYVRTVAGWLYVAAMMDRWSRRIVGLAMAQHLAASLVEQALAQALRRRGPVRACLLHSNRGSQYASASYRAQAALAGLAASMSWAGNCYDNAAMESFWGASSRANWCIGRTLPPGRPPGWRSSITWKYFTTGRGTTACWVSNHLWTLNCNSTNQPVSLSRHCPPNRDSLTASPVWTVCPA